MNCPICMANARKKPRKAIVFWIQTVPILGTMPQYMATCGKCWPDKDKCWNEIYHKVSYEEWQVAIIMQS
jgi:hypothetical protein